MVVVVGVADTFSPYMVGLVAFWIRHARGEGPIAPACEIVVLGRGASNGLVDLCAAGMVPPAHLFGAADHASLPARVVMGQEPPSLPTGTGLPAGW